MMFTNTQATQNMLHDTGLTSQLINGGSTQVSNCGGINNFLEKTALLNDNNTRQDRRPRTQLDESHPTKALKPILNYEDSS